MKNKKLTSLILVLSIIFCLPSNAGRAQQKGCQQRKGTHYQKKDKKMAEAFKSLFYQNASLTKEERVFVKVKEKNSIRCAVMVGVSIVGLTMLSSVLALATGN